MADLGLVVEHNCEILSLKIKPMRIVNEINSLNLKLCT